MAGKCFRKDSMGCNGVHGVTSHSAEFWGEIYFVAKAAGLVLKYSSAIANGSLQIHWGGTMKVTQVTIIRPASCTQQNKALF